MSGSRGGEPGPGADREWLQVNGVNEERPAGPLVYTQPSDSTRRTLADLSNYIVPIYIASGPLIEPLRLQAL